MVLRVFCFPLSLFYAILFFLLNSIAIFKNLPAQFDRQWTFSHGWFPSVGNSTPHDIFLISSYSLLQINEEAPASMCLAPALWHVSFQSFSPKIDFHSPVTVSYLWLLIDSTAVNHLPWLRERKIFSEEGRWGEGRWAGRTAMAESLPQGFHSFSVTCFIPGKMPPYILACLSLTTIL